MKTKKRTTSRRQTQLDRIERKLDELLSRPAVTPPGQWEVPHTYPGNPPMNRPVLYPFGPSGGAIQYA